MNTRSSSYTGRAARNLNEAFGPYTSNQIGEPKPDPDWTLGRLTAAIAAATIMVATCVAPNTANAQFISGKDLYERMQGRNASGVEDKAAVVFAAGYVTGVFDAYKGGSHCAPPGTTVRQVLQLAGQAIESDISVADKLPADMILGRTFSQAWPCPKKGVGA